MYKKYLVKSLVLFLTVMFTIGSINFIIDPGTIYLKKILADMKSAEFSNKLFNSKNGIVADGWNERLIKTTLAKESGNFDCIILGSSHIMQISSVRNTGNIQNQCKRLLNLGVSGGSIEDIAIFSYLILNNIKLPKKVFINIDPWTLKFGMDSRYGAYKKYYNKMNSLLGKSDNGDNTSYTAKLARNLFNGEYLKYSLEELFKKNKKIKNKNNLFEKKIIFPLNAFSYKSGYDKSITLIDGSHVYNKNWIYKKKKSNPYIKIGGGSYKINGVVYDNLTLKYLKKIIKIYKNNGIEVNIILTPYHPNVFKKGNSKPVKHFKLIESIIQKLVKEDNLKLYGSFFPDNIGCQGSEFYDFMHATNECLSKIDFSK